jgi:uncharacterized protein
MSIQFCPQCLWDTPMHLMQRNGIEIDYCAKCRGVWLERGELDKLLELEQAGKSERPSPRDGIVSETTPESGPSKEGDEKRQRRAGILAELFDF